jgi:hypothetical protein
MPCDCCSTKQCLSVEQFCYTHISHIPITCAMELQLTILTKALKACTLAPQSQYHAYVIRMYVRSCLILVNLQNIIALVTQ